MSDTNIEVPAELKMSPAVRSYLAKMNERITELQKASKEIVAQPKRRLYVGRVTMPVPGLAVPKGYHFHNFVDVVIEDTLSQGEVVEPSREGVLAELTAIASERFPTNLGVELHDISELPTSW